MKIINDINYPVLDFLGDTVPWDNRRFEDIWTRLSPEETVRAMVEIPQFMKEMSSFKNLPITHVLQQAPTAKRVMKWPLFAITPDDFESLGRERFVELLGLFNQIWTIPVGKRDDPVELVKGSLWNDMFFKGPDGFDDWLDKKEKEFCIKGTILRPHEGLVEKYAIFYSEETLMEASMAFCDRYCLWAHINFKGFLSKAIPLPDRIRELAVKRNYPEKEVFFQEDMYNILLYLFYKEHFMLKPRKVDKYEIFLEPEGYDSFRLATDVPCVIYDGKNNS